MTQPEGQFGKYQLLDRIATGGMAEIYRAKYQAAAGVTKQVVIKKILPHYAGNKNFVSMFVNEAKIAVGLSHGNIAQVFDFGEISGEYYLAMEFVHGQPLSRVLRKARTLDMPTLPTPVAVMIAMEMCKGLHYAHTRLDDRGKPLNIIHRDVSPQNVILSYEGQVKIVDFGIAKARNAGQTETESGAVKGKYVYFSPEQARGRDVDARTDVFATGIVLYEMLCGKLPFDGKMMEVLGKIIRGDFPRPRAINESIPGSLERILLTSMAIDKTARYPSAQAFQDALGGYLYTNAPNFSAGSLDGLMSYLFEKELLEDGIPVRVPPNFLEQLALWRAPVPEEEEESTRSDKPSSKARAPVPAVRSSRPGLPAVPEGPSLSPLPLPDTLPAIAPPPDLKPLPLPDVLDPLPLPEGEVVTRTGVRVPKPLPVVVERPLLGTRESVTQPGAPRGGVGRWIFVAIPLVAMLLSGAGVYLLGALGSGFSVEVTSSPTGAIVLVDGTPAPQKTPMRIRQLSEGEHTIEVQLAGMKPWARRVSSDKGPYRIDATLEPDRAEPPGRSASSPAP